MSVSRYKKENCESTCRHYMTISMIVVLHQNDEVPQFGFKCVHSTKANIPILFSQKCSLVGNCHIYIYIYTGRTVLESKLKRDFRGYNMFLCG